MVEVLESLAEVALLQKVGQIVARHYQWHRAEVLSFSKSYA